MSSQPNMVFCRGCAKEIHVSAPTCPQCGCVQHTASQSSLSPSNALSQLSEMTLSKKFHVLLMVAASVAVLLLYLTHAVPLIGIATGLSFGASVRIYLLHKANNFSGVKKLDWLVIVGFATAAFICHFAGWYVIQAPLLVFVAVRALVLYLKKN